MQKKRKKVALVLSGGGAKGAFQAAAEAYCREKKRYKWDIIAGVSAGALNATMIAMGKYKRLEEVWKTISKEKVMTGKLSKWNMFKLWWSGKKSIYSNMPLWDLIDKEIDSKLVKTKLRIGTVSLQTGKYYVFTPKHPNFKEAVLASTSIPIVWKPMFISKEFPEMIDGGVRNMSPLGDVLDTNPDEVIIINCNPSEVEPQKEPSKNILDIGKRSLDIAMNEIFKADVKEFLRINELVKQAKKKKLVLKKNNGKPLKYFKCHIIEPKKPLGDTLDFSKQTLNKQWKAGWNQAKKVLG